MSALDPNVVSIIGGCPLFFDLSDEERDQVAREAELSRFHAEAAIFQEYQDPRVLWILGSGQVKLQHASIDGRVQIIEFPAPGAPLALWAVMDGQPLTATATTMGAVTAAQVPRQVFLRIAQRSPGVRVAVVGSLCSSIRVRDIGGGVSALRDVRGRIACRLLQLARQYASADEDGILVRYPMTRQELASATGVAVETAIRTLSDWKRAGVIETVRRMVDIRDVLELQAVAGCGECLFDCSVFGPPLARE